MKFISVDSSGLVNGMYIENPAEGVEFTVDELASQQQRGLIALSDEDWNSVGQGYTYIDGKLSPPTPPDEKTQAEAFYTSSKYIITSNGNAKLSAINQEYSIITPDTWCYQYKEAMSWENDNTYVPLMLNAIIASSNGSLTLQSLSQEIISATEEWKEKSGNILGKIRAKSTSLTERKSSFDSGDIPLSEFINFDCSIN